MISGKRFANWMDVIWREWRATDDAEFARHLMELVSSAREGRKGTLVFILWGQIYGILCGLLASWLVQFIRTAEVPLSFNSPVRPYWLAAAYGWMAGGILLSTCHALGIRRSQGLHRHMLRYKINKACIEGSIFGLISIIGTVLLTSGGGFDHSVIAKIGFVIALIAVPTTVGYAAYTLWLIAITTAAPRRRKLAQLQDEWVYWARRSPVLLEAAIRQAMAYTRSTDKHWIRAISLLEEYREPPGSVGRFIQHLESPDWYRRFAARHALVALGGEVCGRLATLAGNPRGYADAPLWLWLRDGIYRETEGRLRSRAALKCCPVCFAKPSKCSIRAEWNGPVFSFYGCRVCQQSRDFLDVPRGVVAILDESMEEDHLLQDGTLRVNWLRLRKLLDFDRIEIVSASDEDVQRFAIQVGNDTDEYRRPRYKDMHVSIAPGCRLSENTLRIVRDMFGRVDTAKIGGRA